MTLSNLAFAALLLAAKAQPSAAASASPAASQDTTMANYAPDDYLALAMTVAASKDYAKAEKILRDGMAKFPRAQGFHLALGDLSAQQGRDDDAFYEYQWELLRAGADSETGKFAAKRCGDILKSHQSDTEAEPVVVINTMARQETDPKAAAAVWKRLLAKHDRFVLRLFQAEAAHATGDDKAAESDYRALLTQDPNFVPAYLQLADVLEKRGRKNEADDLIAQANRITAH